MEFSFTEEQLMIRDSAESFIAETASSAAVRQAMATEQGFDDALWQRICSDLYWQAIHIPEQYGGMGLGQVELAVLLEQMGRYLLCSPFYSTVCLATNAILLVGTEEQKSQYLPKICEGLTATLAYTGSVAGQRGGQWGAEAITATYVRDGDNFILNGELRYVPNGASAELLIIAAREAGSCDEQGVSLFVVAANTAGIERRWLPTMDQTRKQAAINLQQLILPSSALMGEAGQAWPALAATLDCATVALTAEQMGGSQQVMDITIDYVKERKQFNRTIASFQAIKHMAADMMTRVEVARSGVYYAACAAQEFFDERTEEKSAALAEAASVSKAYCSDAYFKNAGDAIQMHGGVGFTWEYDVHLYFKRAKADEHFLGNGAYHRERLAQSLLDEGVIL